MMRLIWETLMFSMFASSTFARQKAIEAESQQSQTKTLKRGASTVIYILVYFLTTSKMEHYVPEQRKYIPVG